MKKLFFHSLAIALGLAGSHAFGQYPSGYDNFGPSAYPVQTQNGLQSLPQVPQGYSAPQQYQAVSQQQFATQQGYAAQPQFNNVAAQQGPYQLVGAQEQVYSGHNHAPMAETVPAPYYNAPAPAAPMMQTQPIQGDASCQSCTQPAPAFNAQPQVDYGYGQSVAPNSMACGPAPVSQGYVGGPVYNSVGYGNGARHQLLGGHGFTGMPAQARSWFGGAGVLLFNRVDDTAKSLSIDDSSYSDILSTRDARFGVAGGFEATLGRYFNCGRNAIAATYWGVFPEDETVQRTGAAGQFRSRLPFTYLEMPPVATYPTGVGSVYDWYDGAFAHWLQRRAEYHNVEVNLLGFAMGGAARSFNTARNFHAGRQSMFGGHGNSGCGYCGGAGCGSCASACGPAPRFGTGPCNLSAPACGSRLNVSWLAGFRYFRFNDNLLYAASFNDAVIDRSADDLYYEVNTTNDLFGAQLGSRIDYCLGQRINLFGTVRAGVYNNRSTLYSRIGTDDVAAYLNDTRTPTNPNNGDNYVFNATKNDIAFLTELGTGLGMRLTGNWSANVGYRAVIASGVATSVDNIEYAHANYADIRDFNNRGILVLHGMTLGATYNY